MFRLFFLFNSFLISSFTAYSNDSTKIHLSISKESSWENLYRSTKEKKFSLISTNLFAQPHFKSKTLDGRVYIKLSPHAYYQSELELDAKAMTIHFVADAKDTTKPLKYFYDNSTLRIFFKKQLHPSDTISIYIRYTSNPENYDGYASLAISDSKGLYFINSDKSNPYKPTQIWTQGETEATSVWCPTIDAPNQKSTFELTITVPSQYSTLSNGLLIKDEVLGKNRVNTWKISQPIAPYLFFFCVGEFSKISETYEGIEISYYVEKDYAHLAKKIFGETPSILKFYSKKFGVPYKWEKLAQVVCRDYVSGAMENPTSIIHQETAQQDMGDLVDQNSWESVIAHEISHHWFGNLVTTESWSNLTLNESFADYSEYLWLEYRYGKDAAMEHALEHLRNYLATPDASSKNLARFIYKDKEDMFDVVSYNKGGLILNMLRNYLGDDVFFNSLQYYLQRNEFGTAEVTDLRLAFEHMSGKDLNWFFSQWYFGSGHPILKINYSYDTSKKIATVVVNQTQEVPFQIPSKIEVFYGNDSSYLIDIMLKKQTDTFRFEAYQKPTLINFDPDNVLVAEKKENKSVATLHFQFLHATNFIQKVESVDKAFFNQSNDSLAREILLLGIQDTFPTLQIYALKKLLTSSKYFKETFKPIVEELAQKSKSTLVRSEAMKVLTEYNPNDYLKLFVASLNDSSNSVKIAALKGIEKSDHLKASNYAQETVKKYPEKSIYVTCAEIVASNNQENDWKIIKTAYNKTTLFEKFPYLVSYVKYLSGINNPIIVEEGVNLIISTLETVPPGYSFFNTILSNHLNTIKQSYKKSSKYKNLIQRIEKIQEIYE